MNGAHLTDEVTELKLKLMIHEARIAHLEKNLLKLIQMLGGKDD